MGSAVSIPPPAADPEFGPSVVEPRELHARGAHIGEFAIAPGVRVRKHGHDGEVLVLVLAGALSDSGRIAERGGEMLPAGTLRALPAGDRRDLTFGPEGAVCLVVELDDALDRGSGVRIRRRMLSRDPCLTRLAARLRRHLDSPPQVGPSLLLDLDLLELLAQFAREHRHGRLRQAPGWLRRVRDALEEAIAYPDLDRLGEEAGVHPLHIVRTFRDHYGCSMGDIVRRLRLERAYRRIIDTEESLADVAAMSGFSDQSHMTREIRRVFGAPPARLRRVRLQR